MPDNINAKPVYDGYDQVIIHMDALMDDLGIVLAYLLREPDKRGPVVNAAERLGWWRKAWVDGKPSREKAYHAPT